MGIKREPVQDMWYVIFSWYEICSGLQDIQYAMLIAQDMREADQEFVRSGMQRIEEETCLRFQEKEGAQPYSYP